VSENARQDAVYSRIIGNPVEESLFNGESTFTLERRVAREPEWVWRMLTTVDGASQWTPCVPLADITGPGPVEFCENPGGTPVDGTVTVFEPNERLDHAWGAERISWLLSPADGYTDVRLIQTCSSEDAILSCAAGWHVCLATLEAVADGDRAARVVGDDAAAHGWSDLRSEYAEHFGLPAA
jgi:uncharacterized protein YndB with AHSA1/START domain